MDRPLRGADARSIFCAITVANLDFNLPERQAFRQYEVQ